MPRLVNSAPKYRLHRASGQAVVSVAGRDIYLGPHGTKASRRAYDRVVGEWISAGRPSRSLNTGAGITVVELAAAYLRFAKQFYVKNGRPTDEIASIKAAMGFLTRDYTDVDAEDLGPKGLKALQDRMVQHGCSRG